MYTCIRAGASAEAPKARIPARDHALPLYVATPTILLNMRARPALFFYISQVDILTFFPFEPITPRFPCGPLYPSPPLGPIAPGGPTDPS